MASDSSPLLTALFVDLAFAHHIRQQGFAQSHTSHKQLTINTLEYNCPLFTACPGGTRYPASCRCAFLRARDADRLLTRSNTQVRLRPQS